MFTLAYKMYADIQCFVVCWCYSVYSFRHVCINVPHIHTFIHSDMKCMFTCNKCNEICTQVCYIIMM